MMPKNNQMGLNVLQERKPYVLPCPNASGLFSSEEWRNTRMDIPVMLGKAADGTVRMMDLAEATHLLGWCNGKWQGRLHSSAFPVAASALLAR